MCDSLAEKLTGLFSEPRPNVLESCNNDISWANIVRESSLEVRPSADGKFQYYLPNRKALLEVSEYDHHLIQSSLPRQLLHPQSHPSDVQAEKDALDLMAKEISSWGEILSNSEHRSMCLISSHHLIHPSQ